MCQWDLPGEDRDIKVGFTTAKYACSKGLGNVARPPFFKNKATAERLEREVAQWFRALAALPEDQGSVPHTHMLVYNHLSQGTQHLLNCHLRDLNIRDDVILPGYYPHCEPQIP